MRHSTVIIVTGVAGLAAGAAVAVMPVPVLEWAVASSGLSEAMPMAAPPLGDTFRALVCGASAIVAMAVTAMVLPAAKTDSEQRKRHMGFALSRLADFARGRNRKGYEDMPSLRRADAHPDAPPRQPIYAIRDLGEPAPMPSAIAEDMEPAFPAEALDMPRAPEPLPWEAIKAEIARVRGGQDLIAAAAAEEEGFSAGSSQPPLEDMTIADLTARFESGLQRRRESIAASASVEPEAANIVPVSSTVTTIVRPQETDADLQAALAALRGITAKAG